LGPLTGAATSTTVISPGGSADLLAAAWFLQALDREHGLRADNRQQREASPALS